MFVGDFAGTETAVTIPFNAFSSNDPSASITVTDLVAGDVVIFKDGSLTQRSSAAGIAVDIDVDTNVGMHWITIDLTDNTDAGFYSAGSQFVVGVVGMTVDAGTVTAWVGSFTIGKTAAALAAITAAVITNAAGADIAADIIAIKAQTVAIEADTDVIDDATSGLVKIATDVAAILVDTDVIDDGTSGLVKIASDVAAVLVDTAVIGALGAGLTGIPWNAAWDAEVQSEVVDALTAEGYSSTRAGYLDELAAANLPTDIAAIPTTAMRGTDSAALASVATEARLAELDAANLPADVDGITAGVITNAAGADVAADIIALKAETAKIRASLIVKNAIWSDVPVVMVLTSDHVTPATSKTVTGEVSLDGGAFGAVAGTITEVGDGMYSFDAAAADTNGTTGIFKFSETDCDDAWIPFKTVV
jgi:PKD repeat protein